MWFSTVDIGLLHLAEVVFTSFSNAKLPSPASSTVHSPQVRSGKPHSLSGRVEHLPGCLTLFLPFIRVSVGSEVLVLSFGSQSSPTFFASVVLTVQLRPSRAPPGGCGVSDTPREDLAVNVFLHAGTSSSSRSSCLFAVPVPQSAVSPRVTTCFYWRMVLATNTWALEMLMVIFAFQFLSIGSG